MTSININRNVTDLFYRYKMPKIVAKVEGKGNGIKTVIVNMSDVAKSLGRPPTYPTKYFGCELGAQTQFDSKHDRYIVNGSHDTTKLQDLLDGFIKKYVLCPECENPETDLIVNIKKVTISQSCKACGFHGLLKSVHKLNTFIIKNPPNSNLISHTSLAEGKRGKRIKKANGEMNTCPNDSSNSISPDHEKSTKSFTSSIVNTETNEEDDVGKWAVDVSEEAARARLMDLTIGAKSITLTNDLEKNEKDRIDLFYEMVKIKRDKNEIESVIQERELLLEAERLEIKSKSILVLVELLFDENIAHQVKKYRKLLLRFTVDDRKAQKYLITGIEHIISLYKKNLLPKAAGIFQMFYNLDIISEDEFLDWDTKMTKKAIKGVHNEIHKMVQPFINWLKEAEEESDNSDDKNDNSSDSDIEVIYEDSRSFNGSRGFVGNQVKLNMAIGTKQSSSVNEIGGYDDLDIDAI